MDKKSQTKKTHQQISNPTRFGGLAINTCRWAEESKELFARCEETSKELKRKLVSNDNSLPSIQENKEYRKLKEAQLRRIVRQQIDDTQNPQDKRRIEELSLKGTSAWLNAVPIRAEGRYVPKAEFQDAIRMRVGIEPDGMSRICICGQRNSVIHAKNCHRGGYVNLRHDSVRNFIYDKACLVFSDVEKEARLKPVEEQTLNPGANTSVGARSDVRVGSFTRPFQHTHFDIKIINTQADSHALYNPRLALKKAEEGKDRAYKERIEKVENGLFVPLVFTSKGGKSRRCSRTIATIVTKLALKRTQEKSHVAKAIATDLSFIFLRMELACIRGNRKTRSEINAGGLVR